MLLYFHSVLKYYFCRMINGPSIAAKIEELINTRGIKKTRVGEVLGAPKDSATQWKYKKYELFLAKLRKNKVDITELDRVAVFFELPLEYFFNVYSYSLHSSEKSIAKPPEGFEQIAKGLQKLGYSEEFIQGHITALQSFSQK